MKNINLLLVRCLCVSLVVAVQLCLLNLGFAYGQQQSAAKEVKPGQINIVQTVPGNIFYAHDPKQFSIQVAADSIEWACYDYWNNKVLSGKNVVVANTVAFSIEPKGLGWFKLLIDAKKNGLSTGLKETSFAIVSNFDLSKVSESAFMGQTHSWQSAEILLPIAKKMGVKYVRDAIRWDAIEKQKGIYKFGDKQDQFISLLALNGMKPYIVCALYNPLYDNGLSPVTEPAQLAFANYVKQLLGRYPAIADIEIWNEPDIPTFSKGLTTTDEKTNFYFNLLKTSYEQVHPSFPKVKVIGMVLGDVGTDQLVNKILQKGALKFMDEYSFHSYRPVPELIALDIDRHKAIMRSHNGDKLIPINLSETGFTSFTFTEKEQASALPRRIVSALSNGIQRIGIYNLQNKSTLFDREGAYGLIRHQNDTLGAYTPKPGFATYAALTRELSGAKFVEEEAVSPGLIHAYKFKKGGQDVRVMYALSGTGVHLYPKEAAIDVVDVMGNLKTYKAVNGVVSLILDENAIYIKGQLKSPYAKEYVLNASSPVQLKYGFYAGGYTESAGKWFPAIEEVKGQDGKRTRVVAKADLEAKVTWKSAIAIPGDYQLSVYLPSNAALKVNATRNALYTVYVGGKNVKTIQVDQFANQGKWFDLGTYQLSRGTNNYVELTAEQAGQPLRADVISYKLIN
ncbi:golvesin C-terminal-like domain-containing protein [Pedobacter hiemivivus]|uniref:Golvesin/Xly CBD-like domain-containing protein n=1 Tax=Pedobacter hiemivivus TaxID=2530454 RepID=A0A4R0N8X8_9SPHI|nr:hypothetical protein [Pedobacter hiemivivus]TCC96485.1 hypothetical protein EZ444_10910 [Pedobacter hiemivivus]